jgi:molybdopterin-containing oxidoreductase family membrane subunit
MEHAMNNVLSFAIYSVRQMLDGGRAYYAWLGFLALVILVGLSGFAEQVSQGHIVSNLRDPVPWGIFIGTYAFFVGVAAAAVALVVPGYVYHWKPIKEIVVLGEIVAISAVTMCILFVMADLGHPERFWHLLPVVGLPHIPTSMIGTNVMILNGYLILNLVIVTSVLYRSFTKTAPDERLFRLLMLLSIPFAISIHATTAFIFNVLPARPYWNTAILVPRFIATAFVAGPALMILAFQILRKAAGISIKDEALFKIAEVIAVVMCVNLLLMFAEVVTEYRSATSHISHTRYYFEGVGEHIGIGEWAWSGITCNVIALVILLVPSWRTSMNTLNLACVLVFVGVFIEKGIGLILPGLTPGLIGETYEYVPSRVEIMIGVGVAGAGALVFTLMTKVAIPLALTDLDEPSPGGSDGRPNGEQADSSPAFRSGFRTGSESS